MVQRVTRSTCSGGFTNSSERDCTVPVGLVLGSSSGKLHGLLGNLSEGSDRAEVGGKGFWPWWLPSGGSGGSQGGHQSCGRAREG